MALLLYCLFALIVQACNVTKTRWPDKSICELSARAPTVIHGLVTKVKRTGQLALGSFDTASIRVLCIYKDEGGRLAPNQVIEAAPYGPEDICYSPVVVGEEHIFFLGEDRKRKNKSPYFTKYSNGPHSGARDATSEHLRAAAACEGHSHPTGTCTRTEL